MNQSLELLFQSTSLKHQTDKLFQALNGGDRARLDLALSLAKAEYNHSECEMAGTELGRRSFCFHHQKITDQSFLLIHGFTACPFEMREMGEFLHRQGYNVYGVRLAGHGTNVADFVKYGAADWKNSVKLGLAISFFLGRRVIVVGESMGGALTVILGRDYPELISKLILCAPAFRFVNRLACLANWGLVQKLIPVHDMGVKCEWQKPYWYDIIPSSPVADLVEIAREGWKAGPEIKVPTLIIQSVKDSLVRYKGSKKFYRRLSGLTDETKKLILFSNGHHNLTVDLNPRKNEVFKWIDDFVS
jgi:carboxylesterase